MIAVDSKSLASSWADMLGSAAKPPHQAVPAAAPLAPEPAYIDYDAPADTSCVQTMDGPPMQASATLPGCLAEFERQSASTRPGEAAEVRGLAQYANALVGSTLNTRP